MSAIEVHHLKKVYGKTIAIDDISFEVREGEIFGYIGPNGSGKTTTVKILATLTPPTSGSVDVLGLRVGTQDGEIRKRIGVVMQNESYEANSTVGDAMDIYGLLWNIPRRERHTRIEDILESFGLAELRYRHVSELSIGMRRRLQVAREFIHDMDILFLDEPTLGLDPLSRMAFLDLVRAQAKTGVTILLTTHFLAEADYLCDKISLLNHGRIVWEGKPGEFRNKFGGLRTIEITIEKGDLKTFTQTLETIDEVALVMPMVEGEPIKVLTSEPTTVFNSILRLCDDQGVRLRTISLQEPTLEQAFINFMKDRDEMP